MRNTIRFFLIISTFFLSQSVKSQETAVFVNDEKSQELFEKSAQLLEEGLILYREKQYNEAINFFTQVIEKEPLLYMAKTNRGYCHLALNDLSAAKKDFDEVLETFPESHGSWYGVALLSVMNREYEDALESANQAILIRDDISQYHYIRGKSNYGLGRYASAIRDFDSAIELDEKPIYLVERGNAFAKTDDLESAKEDYLRTIELTSPSEEANTNIMLLNSLSGEESSLDELNQKINEDKENPVYYTARGVYFLNKNQTVKAIEDFDKAMSYDPENVSLYINKAAALIKVGHYEEAEELASKAIEINPDLAQSYFNRGIAREMLRNKGGACEDWEQAFLLGIDQAEEFLNSPICNE